MLNPKENARRVVAFDRPERVVGGCPNHQVCFRGCNHEGYEGGGHHLPVGSTWTDIWGVEWHRELDGVMGFPRRFPLADLPHALAHYRWPDPDDERLCRPIHEGAARWVNPAETFLLGSHRDTLWEKAYMLVGMEALMVYFRTEPAAVRELLHRIMDFHLGIARHYLAVGVEMVGLSDDLGTQRGPLLGPAVVGEFLLPEYRRLFALYRARGVLTSFHSCGHILPMLDTFMDLGVNILNPCQATANDLDELRRRTQGRLALQGGVSSVVVVRGPPAAIRAEVAQRLWQLGRDGGYFCGPDQGMPWPPEHLAALRTAVDELGVYPLRSPA